MPNQESQKRAATILGWIAGGSVGLIVSSILRAVVGEGYPSAAANAGAFIAGAFAGMALADRYGQKSIKPLAMVTGVLFSLGLYLVMAVIAGGE